MKVKLQFKSNNSEAYNTLFILSELMDSIKKNKKNPIVQLLILTKCS